MKEPNKGKGLAKGFLYTLHVFTNDEHRMNPGDFRKGRETCLGRKRGVFPISVAQMSRGTHYRVGTGGQIALAFARKGIGRAIFSLSHSVFNKR